MCGTGLKEESAGAFQAAVLIKSGTFYAISMASTLSGSTRCLYGIDTCTICKVRGGVAVLTGGSSTAWW